MWMKALEVTNVVTAFVVLGLLLALFSPLADPARLSVNDQMARIEAGKVTADKVDYRFLRFESERYGIEALKALKKKGGEVGKRAGEALARTNRWPEPTLESRPVDLSRAIIWPKGKVLPPSFRAATWPVGDRSPRCSDGPKPCDVLILDLDRDEREEVVVVQPFPGVDHVDVFAQNEQGRWSHAGAIRTGACKGVGEALVAGHYQTLPPRWPDLMIDGRRYTVESLGPNCGSPGP
jgi:hypothetical protein